MQISNDAGGLLALVDGQVQSHVIQQYISNPLLLPSGKVETSIAQKLDCANSMM